ncbi:MAG TPA: hypothetical protein VGI19_04780 [Candidatus Cybelea sp.]|jgi:hypothetical protein
MTQQNTAASAVAQIHMLAAASLQATLERFIAGTLRRNEAQQCEALMGAYNVFCEGYGCSLVIQHEVSTRDELVERCGQIIELGHALGDQAREHIAAAKALDAATKPSRRTRAASK